MQYKSIWWEAINEDIETLESIMDKNKGWEIFKMFLVYSCEREAYRIVLQKKK
tara:strand:- start:423 stop:581 length:159 start_codon:yes stop_codon:yes gene_type:complete